MKIMRVVLLLAVLLTGAVVARRLLAAGAEDVSIDAGVPLAPVPPMPEGL